MRTACKHIGLLLLLLLLLLERASHECRRIHHALHVAVLTLQEHIGRLSSLRGSTGLVLLLLLLLLLKLLLLLHHELVESARWEGSRIELTESLHGLHGLHWVLLQQGHRLRVETKGSRVELTGTELLLLLRLLWLLWLLLLLLLLRLTHTGHLPKVAKHASSTTILQLRKQVLLHLLLLRLLWLLLLLLLWRPP